MRGSTGSDIVNNLTGHEIKSATIGTANSFVGWNSNSYSPQEDYRLNTALFFALPILHSGVVVRANYSLGVPFSFKDESEAFSPEEEYLKTLARRLKLKTFMVPLSIHLDIYGNAYWYLNRNEAGEIIEITQVQPERVKVKLDEYGEINKYLINFPDYTNKKTTKVIEVDPEDIIHFKEREWTEWPFGNSLISPIIDLCIARLDMNKITPAIYKSYCKPYRHLIYTPGEKEDDTKIKEVIQSMVTALEEVEPDSDLVTTNAWSSSGIQASAGKSETDFLKDIDKQILFQLAIPRFFYDPTGSTDLGINKADRWFLKQMKNRQNYVAQQILERIIIPQLDLVFPDTNNIPTMIFENDYDEPQRRLEILEEFKNGIIEKDEARKELGWEKGDVMKKKVEKAILNARNKKENLELYEKWQDGEIDDKEFLKKVKE